MPFHGEPGSFASGKEVVLQLLKSPATATAFAFGAHTRKVTPVTVATDLFTDAPSSGVCADATDTPMKQKTDRRNARRINW